MDLFFLMYAYGYPSSLFFFIIIAIMARMLFILFKREREKEGSKEGRRRYESGALPSRPPFFRRLVSVCIGWGGHPRWLFICFLVSYLLSCLAFSGVCPSSDDMKRTHPPVDDTYDFCLL